MIKVRQRLASRSSGEGLVCNKLGRRHRGRFRFALITSGPATELVVGRLDGFFGDVGEGDFLAETGGAADAYTGGLVRGGLCGCRRLGGPQRSLSGPMRGPPAGRP